MRRTIFAIAAGAAALIGAPAQATLIGSTVSGDFSIAPTVSGGGFDGYGDTATFLPAVVGAGIEAASFIPQGYGPGWTFSLDVYEGGFDLLIRRQGVLNRFIAASLSLTFSAPVVGAVSFVDAPDLTAGNPYNITSTSTTIDINFGNLDLLGSNATSTYLRYAVAEPAAAPAVPEPTTWAMMLLGFGATGGALRRRKGRAGRRPARA